MLQAPLPALPTRRVQFLGPAGLLPPHQCDRGGSCASSQGPCSPSLTLSCLAAPGLAPRLAPGSAVCDLP